MNKVFNNLFLVLLFLLAGNIMSSCSHSSDSPEENSSGKKRAYLKFNISPVSTRAGTSEYNEKIESLRIIIIDVGENIIECNHYVDLNDENSEPVFASSLKYEYTWPTTPGTKKVYLFANEESVGTVSYEAKEGVTLPSDLDTSLESILNSDELNAGPADVYGDILESIYFSPSYTADTNGDYFLPYVSVYDNIVVGNMAEIEKEAYLVPVATKFTFNFVNMREYAINVKEISLYSANSSNFLFARVGSDDFTKTLPEETTELYWVDWLAEVSKLSQQNGGYSQNVNFNEKYGWITQYDLPASEPLPTQQFFVVGDSWFPVYGVLDNVESTDNETPGKYTAGPFYLPESRNFLNPNDNTSTDDQAYYLTMVLEETAEYKEAPTFEKVKIPNLKALFRNTNVIINITMEQGTIDVYAQIADWTLKSINGYLIEGNVPGYNPFN